MCFFLVWYRQIRLKTRHVREWKKFGSLKKTDHMHFYSDHTLQSLHLQKEIQKMSNGHLGATHFPNSGPPTFQRVDFLVGQILTKARPFPSWLVTPKDGEKYKKILPGSPSFFSSQGYYSNLPSLFRYCWWCRTSANRSSWDMNKTCPVQTIGYILQPSSSANHGGMVLHHQ